MFTGVDYKKLTGCRWLLANVLFAGSIFLWPMQNAFAAPNINLSTSFAAADGARVYMDIGGTWDGSTEVFNGDGFTLSVANTGVDPAYDIRDIPVTVAAGFVLVSNTVTVSATGGCPSMSATASQVGAGNPVTINIASNTSTVINPGCTYNYAFRLATNTSAAAGVQSLGYTVTYNTIDGNNTSAASVVGTQNIAVNAGAVALTKTTAVSNPPNNSAVSFNVAIQNTGTGGLFDVSMSDLLGSGLINLVIVPPGAPPGIVISPSEYRFNYIAAGQTVNVTVQATTDFPLASTTCPTLSNTASVIDRTAIVVPDSTASIPFNLGALSITHLNTSRCVLCGTGTVTLRLSNASGVDVTNLVITEDLLASELRILDNTSTFGGANISNPTPSGTQYRWTLPAAVVPANGFVDLVFDVAYDSVNFNIEEDLARNNTAISASVDYELSCGITQPTVNSPFFQLPLNQALPQVTKLVRNVDANQATYAATTYGHRDDDVIWRVRIQNTGPENLQDVILNDTVTGNFDINYLCPSEASAVSVAGGGPILDCVSAGGGVVTTINNFVMADPFGAPGPDAVLANTFEDVFYVGKITTTCGVETNNNDIEWGCNINSPPGGLNSAAIFAGGTNGNGFATLSTRGNGALSASSVTHTVQGVDGGTEIGSRGIVTITVTNDTGGTIRGVVIDDVLPLSYVVDNTAPITFAFNPAYGNYGGQADEFTHNIDLTAANLLSNTAPQFIVHSGIDRGDNPLMDFDLFRAGDSFTITFQVVLIDPARFDLVADLDLASEVAPGTDPVSIFNFVNDLTITYDDTCTFSAGQIYNETPSFPVNLEDLDVSISDALFILTNNPGVPLNLNVDLTNNGGHVADNYTAYITFGPAMTVQSVDADCVGPVANPPPHPHWDDPAAIPVSAVVYACDSGAIAPGVTERFTFSVTKTAAPPIDDLTFRADVVGEITLFNSNALTLPPPVTIPDTTPNVDQLANNYSFDAIRSRVLGFNLVKSAWYCAEDNLPDPGPPADILSPGATPPNSPPLVGNLNSQIGEDCNYRIESGGWFGFVTAGYSLIEVNNVTVVDDLPDGQGFIPFGGSAYNFLSSTGGILLNGANGGAGTTPLDETDIAWNFNAASGIGVANEFFRVDFKTRLLNNNIDLDYALPLAGPNLHGNTSTNIAKASFTAVFQSAPINGAIQPQISIDVSDTANSPAPGYIVPPGYPAEAIRRVDLTDVEPNVIVTKQVCNESLYGFGTGCTAFADSINDGDTNDSYIYRITLTNETSAPARAPAFNIIATDTLDSSDLMLVVDFASDGLDNNGDGSDLNGDAGEAAMFAAISDNVIGSGGPAVITLNESFGAPFARLDPGTTVTFYYRVDPHITIAPLQTLTNTVSMSYDSLDGLSGNQNIPKFDNTATAPNDVGRARIYSSIPQTADVRMIPLAANPIIVTALSNTPFVLFGDPHDVTVGEEVAYELFANLPVANLRSLKIRNELPPGVRCIEGQVVDLDKPPYDGAGFVPGSTINGPFFSTCTSTGSNDYVEWNFGDQAVTQSNPGDLFNFRIGFVARVENSANTNENTTLTNGGGVVNPVTCTGGVAICYVDDSGTAISFDFAPVDIIVREPVIALTKSFGAVVNSDAGDIMTVTVTASNTSTTVAAYNLQVLDNLVGSDLSYIVGSEAGPDKPDSVDISITNRPVFSWTPPPVPGPDYEILPGAVKTFSFQVQVDTSAQPLKILDNTIEAKWDSLPDLNTALNTITNSIGPDGSVLGLRNGVVPNVGNAPNDYEITASASTSVLPLTMSKTDLNGAVIPAIGAHRNFEVVINLPEGTTQNLIVEDALMAAGVSYALSRNASFEIKYTFVDIVSINDLPPAEAVFRGATAGPPTLPVDGATGSIRWDIGKVITAEEDDLVVNNINPRIIINYYARPNNDAATNVGVTLQNSATVTYNNGETAAIESLNDITAPQTVVEPLLTIGRAVSNITNTGVAPVAGDVLEYIVTINNTGNSTAFDSNIADTLDANLLFDASFTPTVTINAAVVPGFVAVPTGVPAGPLIWGRGNADNTLDIPVGGTLVLTYRSVVQNSIEANVVISNSALVDWTSLDDADLSNAFERTGAGCPAITAPDDYCSAPVAVNITTNDSNNIIKSIIFDTYNEPPLSNALDSIVRVGDTVTYRLEVNIQQGTTNSINILDAVPAGMEFVDVISINGDTTPPYDAPASGAGSNFSYASIPAANTPAAGARLIFNWSLGSVSNDFAGDASTDTLVIEYRARVFENDAATIAQNPSTPLTNSADFTYIDGNGNPSPGDPRLNDTAVLTVLQPVMDALTKTDRSGKNSGDPVNVASDIMNFRLQSCNTTGLARAYGVLLTDNLPTQLNEATLTGPTNGALAPDVYINGALATPGVGNDYVYTPPAARGGNMVFRFNTAIDPGVCIDIDFDIAFYTDFGFGSFSNQVDVNEYYSLPPANAQLYSPLGPASYIMSNPATTIPPPTKVKLSADEATIGDEVVYRITVPGVATGAILYDVTITDVLNASQLYISAIDTGASGFTITDSVLPNNTVNLVIAQIPAGQQAIIELRARVDNNLAANATLNFNNSTSYTYANIPGGLANNAGSDITVNTLSITEPSVVVLKNFTNTTKAGPPDAGDILRYSLTLTAAGGAAAPADFNSDAFDLIIDDSLSLGLAYVSGSETVNGGNTIKPPVIVGDGINTPQSLSWNPGNADDIDIAEGTVVTVTYDVLVLDSVLASQNLSNSVDIQWSSRDGPDANERNGSGVPPLNDYFNLVSATTLQTTPDNNVITKSRLSDTYNPADNIVRIGDIVDYELRINMQEGSSTNFVVQDTLPQGMVFEQTVSINGQTVAPYPAVLPFSHTAIPAAVVAGNPSTGPTTVSWNAGDVINAGDNNISNDDFVIVYRARVLNLVHLQQNNLALTNTVNFDYGLAGGAAPTKISNQLIDLQQPDLSVTKTSLPVAGSIVGAGDVVSYTVEITNNGLSPAYDTELLDTIPFGLRSPTVTMISMSLLSGAPLPPVPLAPVYNPVTGTASWNFDTGVANQYNIPAGDTLRIVYQVQADAGLGAGLTLTNSAQVQFYYSFDNNAAPTVAGINGVREIYGPSNIAAVTLTTVLPNALLKTNPADTSISIGETFNYRITIPDTPQATALYDVQILDNLTASAADLMYVSASRASGSQPWTPVNIGTVTDNLIIADVTNGIDIPANEQVVIDITVTLRDNAPPNVTGLAFTNAASYTFNQINGDNASASIGLGNTTPVMTIVEPNLTLDKRGPAGTVNFLAPIPFTVVLENIGTGPAFDSTIIDQLPAVPDNPPLTGGTCDATPINFNARITTVADEATVVRALALGIDYSATHTAAPSCQLVITALSNAARIEAGEKLIVSYETTLDVGTQSGASLTNIAGATRWFSLDTAGAGATGEIREYTRTITDGTPGTIDFQDAFTVIVEAPVLDVTKTVINFTTGQNPGNDATPGDVLRYTIVVNNSGLVDANAVTISDVIPLNATYVADSVILNGIPVGQPDGGVSPLVTGIDISSSDLTPPLPGVGNGVITVGQSATITFDVLLDPVITSGTVILNQAFVNSPSTGSLPSDDPNVGGSADPTPTLITSAPAFVVQKTSLDITGDAAVLLPGDTLRYTLTVKNVGQEDAINSLLSDQIPANTSYVANSTRLNGAVVADPAAGISPLAAGMLINAPENTTAGYLRADINPAANNVASITFDVVISTTAVNGTLISNQGFFNGSGAGSGVFPQQPSDDPGTALVDDPTIDVVGNVPVVDALKTVLIQNDVNSNGIVDPGDTLRYTITTSNIGALPASNVVLTDAVPVNTTYVANSTTLNTLAVPDAGAGISPLIAGIAMSSSDLTPPLPALGNGVLSAAGTAVVTFDVVVDLPTLAGTIISNQGFIASNELPTEPTDADGNGANGNQPTVVVVGNVQQLAITKQVFVIGGGAAEPGKQLEYVVRVTNIGGIAATNVIISDDMALPVAGQKTYVTGSGLLDGLPAGINVAGSILTATVGNLPAAAVAELRFRVLLDAALNIGDSIVNTANVSWDVPPSTISATASIDIGGIPGSANLNGQVWHDADFSNDVGVSETLLADYRVVLYRNNTQLATTLTDANGVFFFSGLPPNLPTGDAYELRYLAPGASATTASLGDTNSAFTDGAQRISNIFVASGTNVQKLNLPRQPNGVVYDSVLRVPVAGVRLTMINQTRSDQPVPASCFDDPIHANQVTEANGYYKFDLNFSDPARCAPGDEYEIQLLPPSADFVGTTSVIIPPVEAVTGPAQNVPNCPGTAADKIPATALHCENSDSELPPPASIAPRTTGTDYYLKFQFNAADFTGQIYNNHIPVDGILEAAVAISKVASKLNVTRSDLVPYTITFNNTLGVPLFDVSIIDNFPAGFKYVTDSARVDGVAIEPQVNGRVLTWSNLRVDINESRVIKLLLIVGSGVGEGEYVNTARAIDSFTNQGVSGVASATVRVIPDPTFDCSDVIGKVFEDKNLNTYQDEGERGIPGVQVATARGLRVTTDSHGRFHITCAVVANEVRGSNFILKLDDRTLPSGYRVTTENPRVQRATRGKMLKFNFGIAIHRVVRLDLADGVFEKGKTTLRPQWRSRIELLITELQKEGSILRLSYLAENETEDEVNDRLDAIEDLVSDRWQDLDCCYKLTIEKEVFWRKGGPNAGREFE